MFKFHILGAIRIRIFLQVFTIHSNGDCDAWESINNSHIAPYEKYVVGLISAIDTRVVVHRPWVLDSSEVKPCMFGTGNRDS
jgi:hypothetical protein